MSQRKNEAAWVESAKRWQIKVQIDGERHTFADSTDSAAEYVNDAFKRILGW